MFSLTRGFVIANLDDALDLDCVDYILALLDLVANNLYDLWLSGLSSRSSGRLSAFLVLIITIGNISMVFSKDGEMTTLIADSTCKA